LNVLKPGAFSFPVTDGLSSLTGFFCPENGAGGKTVKSEK